MQVYVSNINYSRSLVCISQQLTQNLWLRAGSMRLAVQPRGRDLHYSGTVFLHLEAWELRGLAREWKVFT